MLGDLNRADFPPPMLLSVEDLDRQRLLDDWNGRLAQIATIIAGQRASLKAQQEKLELAARKARSPSVSDALLYEQSNKFAELETKAAEELRPSLDRLASITETAVGADHDDKINRAIRRYAEETIDVGISWLELIQNHRLELLRIASEKGKSRPIISSVDDLEREFAQLAVDEG